MAKKRKRPQKKKPAKKRASPKGYVGPQKGYKGKGPESRAAELRERKMS